jgi:hypothetical protein
MALKRIWGVAALGGCGVLALTFQAPAHADASYTRITTPSSPHAVLDDGGVPHVSLAGTASAGISKVDIYCTRGLGSSAEHQLIASNVPVTSGSFAVTSAVPDLGDAGPVCRLQAVPQGVSPQPELTTSFTGPDLYVDTLTRTSVGPTTVDFMLTGGTAHGQLTARSAGSCGDGSLASLAPALTATQASDGCVGSLGAEGGSVVVDGHPAMLPIGVLAHTGDTSPLGLSVHVAKNGRLTWTETSTLMRCSATDVFPPPSPGACGDVVSTGVQYRRTSTYDATVNQVRQRDSFGSLDGHAHRVRVSYGMAATPPPTGALGFAFPGGSKTFHGSTAGRTITGLTRQAATILVRTDRYAAEGDPQAGTRAITYSRPPTRLAFSGSDATVFAMSYRLSVPANGAARLGFTDSQAVRTADARRMGRGAAAAMMPAPRITSPSKGAVVAGRRTVVKGVVTAGANGLPVSVTVEGHRATLKPTSASRATFRVVLDQAVGRHTVTATARDAGGNVRSTSITMRNK